MPRPAFSRQQEVVRRRTLGKSSSLKQGGTSDLAARTRLAPLGPSCMQTLQQRLQNLRRVENAIKKSYGEGSNS
jgi:hypothetical protein